MIILFKLLLLFHVSILVRLIYVIHVIVVIISCDYFGSVNLFNT
jgi:hypothetical protein